MLVIPRYPRLLAGAAAAATLGLGAAALAQEPAPVAPAPVVNGYVCLSNGCAQQAQIERAGANAAAVAAIKDKLTAVLPPDSQRMIGMMLNNGAITDPHSIRINGVALPDIHEPITGRWSFSVEKPLPPGLSQAQIDAITADRVERRAREVRLANGQ